MKRSLLVAVMLAAALNLVTSAQQVGQNVNVLSGTDPRTGDAFLQRQNEAVIAVSTRNPDHIIVAMNDYRTVDMAYDATTPGTNQGFIARNQAKPNPLSTQAVRAQTPPEAWIGLAASRDRGQTWYNFMLPGYPQDPTTVGQSSPVFGDSAGSDPVLLTGQNGRVYLIALTFDRGGMSRISSSRWTDLNNVEGSIPFHFDFTKQIEKGSMSSKGVFADKPSAAAYAGSGGAFFATSGVSKKKKQVVVVPGCEQLVVAYTRFDGNDANGNFRSSVYASVSGDCGASWSNPTKISGPYTLNGAGYPGTRNQGTAVAVDPDSGAVYVMWRTYEPNGFAIVRSTDGGLTYSAPKPLPATPIYLFDQPLIGVNDGNNATTFRSNAYPSLMVYDGKLVAMWSERVDLASGLPAANGQPRTVMTVGAPNLDGSITWSARKAIDPGDPGAAAPNTRCESEIPESGPPAVPVCRPTGAQVMPFVTGRAGQLAVVHYEARHTDDAPGGIAPGTGYISGMERQLDARAALIDPLTWTTVSSFQISRYAIDPATGRIKENPSAPDPKLRRQVSYPNYPMYRGGLYSFIGDYLHGVPLRPDGSGPGFRFVWTSNESVVPPPDLDFTKYSKPQQGVVSGCNPGSRNATIMTSEVGTGLVVGSPGTFKQLVDATGAPLQRAFAVYVENRTPGFRAFKMTVTPALGVDASFEQFSTVPSVDVEVLASSSVTRTVYLKSTTTGTPTGSALVDVVEIPLVSVPESQRATPLGLAASLTLNGDSTNPYVGGAGGNTDLENTEKHSPQLGTPQLGTPQIGSPQLGTPQLGTPQLGTPQLGTPQISTPQLGSTGPSDPTYTDITFKVTNEGNTASGYNTLVSLSTAKQLQEAGHTFQVIVYRVHQTATMNGCDVGKAQQDQVVYVTPQIGSQDLGTPQLGTPQIGTPQLGTPQLGTPQLGTPQLGTPQLGSPQLGTPQIASASFSIAPADPSQPSSAARATATLAATAGPTASAADGTEHQALANDTLMLTIRVRHPAGENVATAHPDLVTEFTQAVGVAVEAQAANTGQTTPESTFFDHIAPDTTITAAPPNPTINTTAIFSFEGLDNLTLPSQLAFECSFDGAAYTPCTSPITYPGLALGTHTFLVRAIDQAGNIDPTPASRTFTIVPPLQITTAAVLPDAFVGTLYNVTLTASGGTGAYMWSMTGGTTPDGVAWDYIGMFTGMPTYRRDPYRTVTVQLSDSGLPTVSRTFTFPMPPVSQTYVVTNTEDSGPGSLRRALEYANGNVGVLDTITFNIPGTTPFTIAPTATLPGISDPVMIDGWTQPGYVPSGGDPGVPVLELRGNDAMPAGSAGFSVGASAAGTTIRGLTINNFTPAAAGSASYGIMANGVSNLVVEGNYIGTNTTGTERVPNSGGVYVWNSTNARIERNLISGQGTLGSGYRTDGIQISNCTGTRIRGNRIGTNANADAAVGNNGFGIVVASAGTSDTQITDNIISGNPFGGISIQSGATGTVVQANRIGTGADTAVGIGNGRSGFVGAGGINLSSASGNTIEGNTIAHNLSEGVFGQGTSAGNQIQGNSIWDNGGMGIDLWGDSGTTPNQDPEVAGRQNFPVITSANVAGGSTTLTGTLSSRAASGFRVEVFSSDACDWTGGYGEGAHYLGWFPVTTDAAGHGTFNETIPVMPIGGALTVTATATRAVGGQYATSEFSQCFAVPPGTLIGTVHDGSGSVLAGVSVTLTQVGGSATRSASTNGLGTFATSLPAGRWDVSVNNISYEVSLTQVQINSGETLIVDLYPPTGTFGATILDPSNSPISGVTVTATNVDTSAITTMTTDGAGRVSANLASGTYDVRVSSTLRFRITLAAGQNLSFVIRG
jgi:parallel beta-helix repeat protein